MPGKSKHGKGRRSQFRNKPRQAQSAAPVTASSPASQTMPAAAVQPAAKPVSKPVSQVKTQAGKVAAAAEYPFISTELKKIAIITGIIVVIIIVLTFVLK